MNYYQTHRGGRPFSQKHTAKAKNQVRILREQFGLEQHVEKTRDCLRCERPFESTHLGHRLCDNCIGYCRSATGIDE